MVRLIHCPAAFVIGSPNYTGGLFPLVTSGSRYKMLNVTSDASSIDAKNMMTVLVCLSIGDLLSCIMNIAFTNQTRCDILYLRTHMLLFRI